MIIWAALCILCLHEKLAWKISSHQILLLSATFHSHLFHRLVYLPHLCSCTPGWGWRRVRRICLQLPSGPCAQFAFHWYLGLGNREGGCTTWFVVFALASGWPHSLDECWAGRVVLCPLCILTNFYNSLHALCVTAMITNFVMAMEARRLWEDNWISLGRSVVVDLSLLTLIEKNDWAKLPLVFTNLVVKML